MAASMLLSSMDKAEEVTRTRKSGKKGMEFVFLGIEGKNFY